MVSSKPMLPFNTDRKPIVSIVGAGIAGLTLAILLDRQGVEYEIFERAKELRPLGSGMTVGANVAPLMRQLGLYDEFFGLGKPWSKIQVHNNQREFLRTMDVSALTEMAGDSNYIFTRPALHAMLLSKIPKDRVHLSKRVLSMTQNENGVMIRTSDGQTYESDILIGADGAHSAVRQGLYDNLRSEKKLPASDNVPLPFSTVCLVGQTRVLDPEQFPALKLKEAQFMGIDDTKSPYAVTTFTTAQNTMCWSVIQHLNEETSKVNADVFRNSEWGPEAAEQMCDVVRHVAIPGAPPGATPWTLGDIIDLTPKEQMSKVMLEEKVFETWHSGRTALIGDACHKINPSGGQGAINAMHDAIAIANWISVLPSTEIQDVEEIFRQYRKERYPFAKEAFQSSKMLRKLGGTTVEAKILNYISTHMPAWLMRLALAKSAANRPQLSFLPQVEDKGTVKPSYQASLDKTLKIIKAQQTGSSQSATKVV